MRQFLTLTAAALALSACHPPSVGAGGAKGKGLLETVDGMASVEQVTAAILAALQRRK